MSKQLALLALLALVLAAACSTTSYSLQGNQLDPSAAGTVNVSRGDNGNTLVNVRVKYLAPPDRLNPADTTYVVWVASPEQRTPPQNLGALQVSKDLSGRLDAVTVLDRFRIFITPEASAEVSAPNGPHVLEGFVEHVK